MNNLKATLYFLTPEEGGRPTPINITSFRNYSIWFNSFGNIGPNAWSIGLFFDKEITIEPGSTHTARLGFFTEQAYQYFKIDDELIICEGPIVIAKGKIIDGRSNSFT